MNIGIVTTWFERGGAYVSRAYKSLLETENNVFIYARGGEDYAVNNILWDNKEVTWGKKSYIPIPTPIDYQDFIKWLREKNIEIVFFNEQHYWHPVLWCNDLNIICGAYIDYYTEETIPLFNNYDFLICNTQRHYSAFSWHPKCYYIPWGTDIRLFSPTTFKAVEENVITFFASVGYDPCRKGIDMVIKAFSQLKGDAKLIIHSQKSLKEYFPNLKELIIQLENTGKLTCIEKTVSAPGLYHLGDIYVYPSRLDGIGLSMAEALACGLPIIVSDNPPMNEFVNEKNGKLIKVSRLFARSDGYYWPQCQTDCDHLIKLMQEYIDNIDQLMCYKQQARRYAEQKLNWEERKELLLNVFSEAQKTPVLKNQKEYSEAQNYDFKRIGKLRHNISVNHSYFYTILRKMKELLIRLLDDKF